MFLNIFSLFVCSVFLWYVFNYKKTAQIYFLFISILGILNFFCIPKIVNKNFSEEVWDLLYGADFLVSVICAVAFTTLIFPSLNSGNEKLVK